MVVDVITGDEMEPNGLVSFNIAQTYQFAPDTSVDAIVRDKAFLASFVKERPMGDKGLLCNSPGISSPSV